MDRSEELLVRVEKKQQSGEASYGERASTWATQHEEEISRWRRPTFQKVGAQKKKKCRVSFPISPVESCQRLAGAGDCALGFKGLFLNVGLFENLITSHLDV